MPVLAEWQNFYVIVGSSAGALIGLQFVVLALVSDRRQGRVPAQAGAAFSTPTVMHFCAALLLSGLMAAPWGRLASASLTWGALGFCGLVYAAIVGRRMRKSPYQPVLEDWLFHFWLPLGAYAALLAGALGARARPHAALGAVACAALTLLFAGIHNSWDAVTYHIYT